MAMLQRRFASSVYAVRRTLERMKGKREKIVADPEAYRREQISRKLPEDFEDLPEEEREEIVAQLEDVVASVDPVALREEIPQLGKLIAQACELEEREVERKLVVLKDVLTMRGVFSDPKMKLLLFTEHKDTLDFLADDGKEGRLLGKLVKWGLAEQGSLPMPPVRTPAIPASLKWSGEIPPQKWMNFYTKVLSKFVGSASLRLTLSIEVSSTEGVSPQRIEETKIALQELGLSDNINAQ